MAQFEKGKGTRKRTVTINQLGTLLTKDEIDGVSQMLTGYSRYQTVESARAKLISEAATLIADGLAPVDKIAKEIAALIPAKPKSKKQELPIRQDLYVYNEATGMMLTSKKMAGKYLEEGSDEWKQALSKGDILPMSLIQDDPGYEKEWQGLSYPDESAQPDYVHFLAHLVPVKVVPKDGLSNLPEDGWFGEAVNARLPKRCPLGLEGREVIGHRQEITGSWIFAQDAFKLVEGSKLTSVKGGAISLPLNEVALSIRLGWFRSRMALSGIRVKLKDMNQVNLGSTIPEGIVAAPDGNFINFIFSNDLEPFALLQKAIELEKFLSKLPEGTVLESCSTLSDDYPGTNSEVARQRFQGVIKDGRWQVESSYPASNRETLSDIFKLARESIAGTKITVIDKTEGESILAWAKRNFRYQLEENKPLLEGNSIKLKKSDKSLLALVGAAAFAVRFGSNWKVVVLEEDDDDDWEDEDDSEETSKGDPWDLKQPIKGAEVLRSSNGRIYFQTMAMLTSEKLSQMIQSEEPKLRALRFSHVGDTFCNLYPNTAVRGYTQKDGVTWAMILVAAPDKLILELYSRFEDGASVVTYRHMQVQDEPGRKIYRQSIIDGATKDLFESIYPNCLNWNQSMGSLFKLYLLYSDLQRLEKPSW